MKQYEYKVSFSADVRKAVPSIGDSLKSLDDALATCGARYDIRADMVVMSVECDRQLTKKERAMLKELTLLGLRKRFPDYDFAAGTMRQKSRKSRSSVST